MRDYGLVGLLVWLIVALVLIWALVQVVQAIA